MVSFLVCDKVDEHLVKSLEKQNLKVEVKTGLNETQICEMIPNFEAIVVRSATKVTKKILDSGTSLKLVCRAGVGLDNVDTKYASEKGITVLNTPDANTIAACEHTCTLILASCRMLPQAHSSLTSGHWDRSSFMGVEVFGKVLGVVGLGRIGIQVAVRMQAFGMKVIGFDPLYPLDIAQANNIEFKSLEEVLSQSDFITFHVPLLESTKHMGNYDSLKNCKNGATIVNCSRGGIINEKDLVKLLDEGHLRCAALDVFEEEPPTYKPVINHPKVIVTPHLGASTCEAQKRVSVELVDRILNYLSSGKEQ